MVLTFWRLVSPCLVDSPSFQLEMEGSHWWKIEWPSCLRGGSCNVSGDINGAFVKTKDSLDFGLWENFLRSFMLKPFSLLCFLVPLMVLALLSLLLSLLLRLDESEDLWVVLRPTSLGGGWTILTVHDSDAIDFLFYFIFVHTHIHTQIPPSPATGSIRRRFYEAMVAAVVAVKECSGCRVHTCMSLRNVRSESFPSLSEIPPFQRLTVVEWCRGPSSFSSKEQGKGKRIAFLCGWLALALIHFSSLTKMIILCTQGMKEKVVIRYVNKHKSKQYK